MSEIRYCSECGNPVEPDALFCPECGSPISQDEPESYDLGGGGNQSVEVERPDQNTNTDKKKLYLILSVVAVVVLGGAIILFSMKGKKDDSGQADTVAEVQEETEETDIEELGKTADINGVENTKCTITGTVRDGAVSLETAQSIYGYDEDGAPRYLDSVDSIVIENDLDSVELEDYEERQVEAVGQIVVNGDQAVLDLLTIETTDGPLYDETEGGIQRYEIVVRDCGWTQAYQESLQKGGYLVRINSKEEYDYILQMISQSGYDKVHFYLGGRRDPDSQEYYWIDENNQTYGVQLNNNPEAWCNGLWMSGEPSFSDPNLNIDEAYLNIFYYPSEGRWIWNDGPENIPSVVGTLSGYVGYIVEYDLDMPEGRAYLVE